MQVREKAAPGSGGGNLGPLMGWLPWGQGADAPEQRSSRITQRDRPGEYRKAIVMKPNQARDGKPRELLTGSTPSRAVEVVDWV